MQRGTSHTPEARAKMSATRKGRTHSPEHRAAIAAALSNRRQDPEVNARRAQAMRAYWAARRDSDGSSETGAVGQVHP